MSVSANGNSTSSTPGQQLRLAREACGLSLNDVNAETNLSVKYLQALEADDFAALPGLAFARGYARRYAQLVHLDGATLIAEIDALAASKGIVVTPALASSNPAMQRASLGFSEVNARKASDVPSVIPKLMAMLQQISISQILSLGSLALLLLLLLGTLFWQGNKTDVVEPLADHGVLDIDADVAQQVPPEAPVTPEVISPVPPVGSELVGAVTTAQPATDPASATATATAIAPDASALPAATTPAPLSTPQTPVPAPVAAPAPAPAPVTAPASATKATTVAPAQASLVPAPGSTAVASKPIAPATKPALVAAPAPKPVAPTPVPATAIKPVASVAPPPGIDSLNFSFIGKSWISVRDATGQELVYGLKNAGQAVTVTGQAPFSINIGNVHVTSLSRNGRSVNLKQYARGEIASFRLAPVAPAPVPKP
ncbi:helix-turn-helix domain-containing protein [Perlucidibaca aquatica]|uniref:helix-turn-helix domain-containing protein n=1 Tax=Perlucidibaca aquatica TaxID=1852776 RepID=UPI00083ADF1D|nr:helix-turn-helix domain-containing protein [Perlucidibaca aquatica]